MKTASRPHATLGIKQANIPHLLQRARAIHDGIAGHAAIFVTPAPPLATLDTRITALDQAQKDSASRTKGTASARDVRAEELATSLRTARAYVQELVDQSPAQGIAIIDAAGMIVGTSPGRNKPLLAASQTKPGAPVRLVANVGVLSAGLRGKVLFLWQSSTDGGKTWDDRKPTTHGTTEVNDLPPLVTCSFRCAAHAAKGASDWSQVVTLLVR